MSDPNLLSLAFLKQRPKAAAALLEDFTPEHCVEFLQDIPVEVAFTYLPVRIFRSRKM